MQGKTLQEKLKHRIECGCGYVVSTEEETNKSTENICKMCTFPQKEKTKKIIKLNIRKSHG